MRWWRWCWWWWCLGHSAVKAVATCRIDAAGHFWCGTCSCVLRLTVFSLLVTLLTLPGTQVRTYVHGTLYSVLRRVAVRHVALARGTPDLLAAVAHTAPPPFDAQVGRG